MRHKIVWAVRRPLAWTHTRVHTPALALTACANRLNCIIAFSIFRARRNFVRAYRVYLLSEFRIFMRAVPLEWHRNYSSSYGHVLPHALNNTRNNGVYFMLLNTALHIFLLFSLSDWILRLTWIHLFGWDGWGASRVRSISMEGDTHKRAALLIYLSVEVDAPHLNDSWIFFLLSFRVSGDTNWFQVRVRLNETEIWLFLLLN